MVPAVCRASFAFVSLIVVGNSKLVRKSGWFCVCPEGRCRYGGRHVCAACMRMQNYFRRCGLSRFNKTGFHIVAAGLRTRIFRSRESVDIRDHLPCRTTLKSSRNNPPNNYLKISHQYPLWCPSALFCYG